jgi:ketosteroid isomerase-like protein
MSDDLTTKEVLAAADSIVHAFGSHDADSYFGGFSPQATFVFYNHPSIISSVAEYRKVWHSWEEQGFRVLECHSRERSVHVLDDDHAIFTHRVETSLAGESVNVRERETIVFRRSNATWLAVHEHLSPDPAQ